MSLKLKYGIHYDRLGDLRNFIESGTMLASVNFWRDSFQNYREFEVVENRSTFISRYFPNYNNEFINSFWGEEFSSSMRSIGMSEASEILSIIRDKESEETYRYLKNCIISYSLEIAKSSKEDWLAFLGMTDNISDKEAVFIRNLDTLLRES